MVLFRYQPLTRSFPDLYPRTYGTLQVPTNDTFISILTDTFITYLHPGRYILFRYQLSKMIRGSVDFPALPAMDARLSLANFNVTLYIRF